MATRNGKDLLTREDWIRAALDALATGGVAAVAVDRIARVMGTTRGSFYWHFSGRRDLVDAALARWERDNTVERIARLETVADPAKRLRVLFREVFEQPVDAIEIALAAAGDDPLVAPVGPASRGAGSTSCAGSSASSDATRPRPHTAPGSPTASTSATTSSFAIPTSDATAPMTCAGSSPC